MTARGLKGAKSMIATHWSIDFWPMRLIVSLYLILTGAMLAGVALFAGYAIQASQALGRVVAKAVVGAVTHAGPAAVTAAPMSMTPFYLTAAGIAAVFIVATGLMWIRFRGHWLPALVVAMASAVTWWTLVYAAWMRPAPQSPAALAVFAALTAVMTLGALVAIIRRAPGPAAS
jgi:hypothetical protein